MESSSEWVYIYEQCENLQMQDIQQLKGLGDINRTQLCAAHSNVRIFSGNIMLLHLDLARLLQSIIKSGSNPCSATLTLQRVRKGRVYLLVGSIQVQSVSV